MTVSTGTGLARVTIAAPRRRLDVALPENVPVAELLPGLLRHAGEGLADEGEAHGGWVLRRPDGSPLEASRTLQSQNVRDGEVLHLVPRRTEWPELDYDDVVDAIATGARRYGIQWSRRATRICGLTLGSVLLAIGTVVLYLSGPPWLAPGILGLSIALVLVVIGTVLSRAISEGLAGAILASIGLPYAFLGGTLLLGSERAISQFGAAHLLIGSASLLVISLIGYFGVAELPRLFVAGVVAGFVGCVAALLGYLGVSPIDCAAIITTALLALLPAYPLIALRVGKVPVPQLPTTPEELLQDEPMPERAQVVAAVVRADELLTGMLLGASCVTAVSAFLLAREEGRSAPLLAGIVALSYLLRARLFPVVRQRLPLLLVGLWLVIVLTLDYTLTLSTTLRMAAVLSGLIVVGGLVVTSGLTYSRRNPSPYFGRYADILDVLLIVALLPVTCAVLGLYSYVRGLGG